MWIRLVALLLALAGSASAEPAGQAESATSGDSTGEDRTAIPGTRFGLVVPDGFELAREFAGIVSEDASATIHVVELPVSVDQVRSSFTQEQLAERELVLLESEEVAAEIGAAWLLEVEHEVGGVAQRKWILIGGADDRSLLITASAPTARADELEAALRRGLLTARWDPAAAAATGVALGFSVSETDDLKIAQTIMGSALILTRGGSRDPLAPGDPYLVVAPSTSEMAIDDLGDFSRQRLEQSSTIRDPVVTGESETVITGRPAHELYATAVTEGGEPLAVYQAVAFDGRRHFLIHGRVASEDGDRYLEQFRAIARSLATAP